MELNSVIRNLSLVYWRTLYVWLVDILLDAERKGSDRTEYACMLGEFS